MPTGSMAPTLLGWHREIALPNCRFVFVVGIDEEGQPGEAVCPNCGRRDLDTRPSIECGGDRVLVQKFLYEFRRPKRWEVAVFHFPGEPSQAYVKRVVGLPGESIRIIGGDVFVDGQIARKSLAEIRAMRMLVHDSRFQPRTPGDFPAGSFGPGSRRRVVASGWISRRRAVRARAGRPASRPRTTGSSTGTGTRADGGYGPVRDFLWLQRRRAARADNEVKDLGLEARLRVSDVRRGDLGWRCGRVAIGSSCGFRSTPAARSSWSATASACRSANCWNPFLKRSLWPRDVTAGSAVFDRPVPGGHRRSAALRAV